MANATGKPAITPAGKLTSRFRADLKLAMRARDGERIALLRVLIAAIDNAGAVTVNDAQSRSLQARFGDDANEIARREPDEAELTELLECEAGSRRIAAQDYVKAGRNAEAERLEREANTIAGYLTPTG